jgi:hypothetical protein
MLDKVSYICIRNIATIVFFSQIFNFERFFMKKWNRSFNAPALLVAAFLAFFSSTALGQVVPTNIYHGALVYSLPLLRTVPAVNSSQPTNISTDYLWLDDAFRLIKPGFTIDNYINSLSDGDTLQYLASILYQVVDDNPITYMRWQGASPWPYPYHEAPGEVRTCLQSRFSKLAVDTNRTPFLLDADIIADVTVTDTAQFLWPSDAITPRSVVVTCSILDGIKGKYVPGCGFIYKSRHQGGLQTLSAPFAPVMADTVPSTVGACFQFEYRPNWARGIASDAIGFGPELTDSNGDWIKIDSEYVIFLNFTGLTADNSNGYYALMPNWGWFGSMDGLYPVRGGKVYDPNDDFGIGASVSGGLSVAEWKTRVRARINSIIYP